MTQAGVIDVVPDTQKLNFPSWLGSAKMSSWQKSQSPALINKEGMGPGGLLMYCCCTGLRGRITHIRGRGSQGYTLLPSRTGQGIPGKKHTGEAEGGGQ